MKNDALSRHRDIFECSLNLKETRIAGVEMLKQKTKKSWDTL